MQSDDFLFQRMWIGVVDVGKKIMFVTFLLVFLTANVFAESTKAYEIDIEGGSVRFVEDSTPLISGTVTAPNDTVLQLELDGMKANILVQNGKWNWRPYKNLKEGVQTLLVTATNPAGVTNTAQQKIWVVKQQYSITLSDGQTGAEIKKLEMLSGSTNAPDGLSVVARRASVAGEVLGSGITQAGKWQIFLSPALMTGTHGLEVKVMAGDKTVAQLKQIITVNVKSVGFAFDNKSAIFVTPFDKISGTINLDGDVPLLLSWNGKKQAVLAKNKKWIVTPNPPISEGRHEICVAIDEAKRKDLSGSRCTFFETKFIKLNHKRTMNGYADGSFRPDRPVMRSELAHMIAQLIDQSPQKSLFVMKSGTPKIIDVPKNHVHRNAVERVVRMGLMSVSTNGRFSPQEMVNREAVKAIVSRVMQLTKNVQRPTWATADLNAYLKDQKVSVAPRVFQNKLSSRAEVTVVLNRLFQRGPLYNVKKATWRDVTTSHWAFADVEEATRAHTSLRTANGEWLIQ